jgi:lipopolysaccharide transport system ATP-binding protein
MSEHVICVEGLGKRYYVGARESRELLSERLAHTLRNPLSLIRRKPIKAFWALKNISFDVREGEVLGLIGRNGAGKSTLLKILSRITRPTVGQARILGRVGSLLEVGTGFHPELTGRENVFMNGSILGMSKREIQRKFDEIVAFAEIEPFLDTPVKRYSSGMYVRLAFAVAAHLDPEILLVDEVLAVGDASFQHKCLGKMKDVTRQGRTILFVSHNMAAVRALCQKGIFLKEGEVASAGDIATVADNYVRSVSSRGGMQWRDTGSTDRNDDIRLSYVSITPPHGEAQITIDTGVQIEIGFRNLLDNINLGFTIYLTNGEGVLVFESGHVISSDHDSRRGSYHLKGNIPGHLLNAGHYSLDVLVGKDQRYPLFRMDEVVSFEVENTATGRGKNMGVAPGVIRPLLPWCHSFEEEPSLIKQI